MAELKEKEKADYKKILTDPAYKQSLGLTTEASICDYLGITPVTKSKWKEQFYTPVGDDFSIKDYLNRPENKRKLVEAALKAATTGANSKSMETLFKLLGELDKSKEGVNKIEYTNDDISRESGKFLDYLREISKRNNGICCLCGKPDFLLGEVRPDKVNRGEVHTLQSVSIPEGSVT
jgi:hypothetical protein